MAGVAASASPCGSALAPSITSSRSLRRVSVGRSLKPPFHSGSTRFAPFLVQATTSTEKTSASSVSRTPTVPVTPTTEEASPAPVTSTTEKTPSVPVTSTTGETTSLQGDEIIADLKARWDAIENKNNVLIYGAGALVALWVSASIVGAVNTVPLLPKVLELVGLGYSGWFVYRYLLFKESRKQLAVEIDDLKAKITGVAKEVTEEGLE